MIYNKKARFLRAFFGDSPLVEMRRVELLSENPFPNPSPSAVNLLNLPSNIAD